MKKLKPNDSTDSVSRKILPDVINWESPQLIAIEYHVCGNHIEITYNTLYNVSKSIEKLVKNCCNSQFIGINSDIPPVCIPSLMIGTNLANCAFVCLQSSPSDSTLFNSELEIGYIFAKKLLDNTELIEELHIHDESLLFLKFKGYSLKNPVEKENVYTYAVTTSGSTGNPKVVRVTHASIIPNIADLKKILELSSEDKVAQLTPLTFDPSVIEIFIALSCSGTLFISSEDMKNDPQKLLETITTRSVTIMQSTPSLLMHRWSFSELRSKMFGEQSHLRILLLGGERFPSPQKLFDLKHPANKCRLFNIYGITEVSCWASINEILPQSDPSDLGQVLDETIFEIRDENDKVVTQGEGHLYVGSKSRICLLNNEILEELKYPVFRDTGDLVTCNNSGKIFLNGRKNRRVKRFGHRMDLQDLENRINELDFIGNSCALFIPVTQKLYIFFTLRYECNNENGSDNFEHNVLEHLKKLPSIYHPDKIFLIKSFTITTNGKICINSLRRICYTYEEKINISDSAKVFHAIWNNYGIGQDSGFIESGGTSVIALQIANEISEKTGNEYPELIGRMLRNETLESCTAYISQVKLNVPDRIIKSDETMKFQKTLNSLEDNEILHPKIQKSRNDNEWLWQKNKGRISFNNNEPLKNIHNWKSNGEIKTISIKQSYNLLKCVDASPTIFSYSGQIYASVGSHSGIICTTRLEQENSTEEKWNVVLPDRIEASILIANNFMGIVGCYDGFLYYINLKSGAIQWKVKTGDIIKCSAVFCSKKMKVFIGSYDHYIYCVSLEDGSTIWKAKLCDSSIVATPIVHERTNSVLLGTLDGTCVSLDQNKGNLLWMCHFKDPIFSAPVISCNKSIIFCDVSGVLAAFDIENGNQIWKMDIKGNVFAHLVIQKNRATATENLVLASRNQNLYIFRIESHTERPKLQKKIEFSSPIIATPWIDDNFLAVATIKGELIIINSVNNHILTKYQFENEVYSSPVVHENLITIGCRDNNLYILLCK